MTDSDHPPHGPVRDDLEDLDPGLARERTRLAWRRTAIAVTAVAIAVLKIDPVAGAPLVVTAGALWAVGPQLERTGPMSRATRPRRRAVRLIALVTLVTALVALGVALSAGGTTRQFHRTVGPAGTPSPTTAQCSAAQCLCPDTTMIALLTSSSPRGPEIESRGSPDSE